MEAQRDYLKFNDLAGQHQNNNLLRWNNTT